MGFFFWAKTEGPPSRPLFVSAERNTTSRKALEVHVTASLPKATTERSSSKRALPAAPGSSSSSDDLFSLATQQLEQAHHILATYDAACKLVAEAKFPEGELGEGWDTDFECVRELLELGQRVAQRQIDALAGAVSGEPLDGGEQFRVAAHLKMQQGGSNGSAVASFHDLLRDTERGVTRLTRGLPSDKEGC